MLKKKKIFFLLAAGLIVVAVTVTHAQKRAKAKPSSLLWKISGNGLPFPSYLFGTIHLICPDQYLWTPAMEQALNTCRQVAFELDMDAPELSEDVQAGLLLPEGKTLKDYFSPEAYLRLKVYAQDTLGIPEAMLRQMHPFALLGIAITKSCHCNSTPTSYEQRITAWAKANHREIIGLETTADQLAVIHEMDNGAIAQQVIRLLDNPKQPEHQYKALLTAYLHQDLNALYQIIIESPDMQTDLQALLYDRNKKWLPKIEAVIREKTTFIAVGAGHLSGQEGLIQSLQQAGYTVTPVMSSHK